MKLKNIYWPPVIVCLCVLLFWLFIGWYCLVKHNRERVPAVGTGSSIQRVPEAGTGNGRIR